MKKIFKKEKNSTNSQEKINDIDNNSDQNPETSALRSSPALAFLDLQEQYDDLYEKYKSQTVLHAKMIDSYESDLESKNNEILKIKREKFKDLFFLICKTI